MTETGPIIVHTPGTSDPGWLGNAIYPTMTKEYTTAAAPSRRDNSGPTKSHFASFMAQDTLYSTPPHAMAIPNSNSRTGPTRLPQPHISLNDTRRRLPDGLPQRPETHIRQRDAAKMSQPGICRKFVAGNCSWGDKCHLSHSPAAPSPMPPNVMVYTDRMGNTHRIPVNQPGSPPVTATIQPALGREGLGPTPPNPPPFPSSAPSLAKMTHPLPPKPPNAVVARPEVLDHERLSRAAEEDPRPSRRTDEVCEMFQKGLCRFGDQCHRTHIFRVPEACITHLLPPPPKPRSRNIPKTVMYTAPDGSISEREVCKLGAVGQCPRGESCRYLHITIPSDEEEEEDEISNVGMIATSSKRQHGPDHDIGDAGQIAPTERSAQVETELTVGSRANSTPKKSREVCRLYWKKRFCYKLPCRFSHNILDLAQLPPDDELVLIHSDEIRVALAERKEKSPSTSTLPPQPVADTAKKRQKRPRKPGADSPLVGDQTNIASNSNSSHVPHGASKGKGRPDNKPSVTSDSLATLKSSGKVSEQEAEEELEGDSTDATYHSARESYDTNSQGTQDLDPTSERGGTRDLPCYDFIHGRCHYRNCKFSHDLDRERMRQEFLMSARGPSSTSENPTTHPRARDPQRNAPIPKTVAHSKHRSFPTQDVSLRAVSNGSVATSSRGRAISGTQEPAVPPGLGLEQPIPAPPQNLHPRVPPESITITVLDSTKVTFGPGFNITHITTGFECRQILLEDVPNTIDPAAVSAKLAPYGTVTTVTPVDSGDGATRSYRVTFASGNAAADAVAALHESEVFGAQISARLVEKKSTALGGGTLYDGDVLFLLPTPYQVGFVGYPTEELAQKAIAYASHANIGYSRVTGELYEGIPAVGAYNVRFRGLPPTFTVDDLKKHFADTLDRNESGIRDGKKKGGRRGGKGKGKGKEQPQDEKSQSEPVEEKFEGAMLQRAKYNSLQGAIHGLRRMLEEHDEDVSLNVLPPPYRKYVRVWAHFTSPDAAARACEALNRFCPRFVGKERIFARHIKSLRYTLPASIFTVMAYDINLLRSYIHDEEGTSISVIDRRAALGPALPVTVKLVSESMASLTKAKAAFDQLLRGEKVMDNGQVVWNDYFGSKAGAAFLQGLEQIYPKVRISSDFRRRTLALFGVQEERERVRAEIINRARLIQSQLIHRYPVAGNLVGVFMSEDLVVLQKELGHENVWFDITHQQLVVRGDEDAQKVAQLAVLHTRQREARVRPSNDDAACPVCFGEVSHPVTLACGHTWCKACLAGYLKASIDSKAFPLTCLADGARCTQPIALATAQRLLSTEEFDAVVTAAFVAHVQQRPREFRYCPTPDCPQVYRTPAAGATARGAAPLQCPSCLVRICPHCHTEAHETVSCQDRNPEDEALFETWKMGHDVKDCPGCKVPIERTAGCNHMTCASCKVHICWVCLATFSRSGDVYDHMRSTHGGIGL